MTNAHAYLLIEKTSGWDRVRKSEKGTRKVLTFRGNVQKPNDPASSNPVTLYYTSLD